jgi:DNA-binding Xre family transcriptional regulator
MRQLLKGTNGVAYVKNRLKEIILDIKAKRNIKTQRELAEMVGMDEARLSRFLRMEDTRLINMDVLEALYENFQLTPNDVLMVQEEQEQ